MGGLRDLQRSSLPHLQELSSAKEAALEAGDYHAVKVSGATFHIYIHMPEMAGNAYSATLRPAHLTCKNSHLEERRFYLRRGFTSAP